jgi:hypothetical protein
MLVRKERPCVTVGAVVLAHGAPTPVRTGTVPSPAIPVFQRRFRPARTRSAPETGSTDRRVA